MDAENESEIMYFVDTPLQSHEEAPSISIGESIADGSTDEIVVGSEPAAGTGNSNQDLETVETIFEEGSDKPVTSVVKPITCLVQPNEKVVVLSSFDDDYAINEHEMEEGEEIANANENPESSGADSHLICKFCNRKFTKFSNKLRHIRRSHNIKINSGTCIKCMECNLGFGQLYKLRDHLAAYHKLEMVEHELIFPNMEAFQKWKCEIERKTLCSYTLRHGARKGPNGPRYFYSCHRSGKYFPKTKSPLGERKRILKTQGSCKMGILCTASITVHVTPKKVWVRFCPNHYGHGKETSLIQLSAQEQTAIKESVAQGMSYEKLLDEIRDAQSTKDHFQLYLLKKKDIRGINNAFNCDDFNTSMSDAESVDHWVSVCCQMENSPVLYYRKEELSSDKKQQEDFILIIMTEYQKHILQLCDKDVICVDSLYRKKGGRFYLTVLFIMDETDLAFPVAYCISNRVDQNIIATFYQSLKEAAGELSCKFFMSDCESFYYDMWKMVMNENPRWLWSMWYVDSRFRIQLRVFRGKMQKRAEAYRTMRMLLECQNPTVFQCMLKNFAENLKNDPDAKDLGNVVEQHYAPNAEIWAYCYRKDIDLSTNIHLEIMHRTFRYCCREGRKTRLDKFIFVIMKLVRDKMFERLCSLLDDDKIEIALTTINECHKLGLEIPAEAITALSDKTWLIQIEDDEDNYYVTREYEKCPELCNLKCAECSICVHMYICSCVHNLINANLCPHIHAVVWHLLTPHFTPPPSPVALLDVTNMEEPEVESTFFSSLLTRCHDVYKQIQANKTNLNSLALNSLMRRLNECVDICAGKLVDEEEKNKIKVEVPSLNYQPPVYFINSVPMATGMRNDPILLSSPAPASSCGQTMIFPKPAPVASGSRSILLPHPTSTTSNKPIQISKVVSNTTTHCPIVISNSVSSTKNKGLSNTVSGATNTNHPIVISTIAPTASSYRPILLPNITGASSASGVKPSSTPLGAQNFLAAQGANGIFYLLPSNTMQIKTEKT